MIASLFAFDAGARSNGKREAPRDTSGKIATADPLAHITFGRNNFPIQPPSS